MTAIWAPDPEYVRCAQCGDLFWVGDVGSFLCFVPHCPVDGGIDSEEVDQDDEPPEWCAAAPLPGAGRTG